MKAKSRLLRYLLSVLTVVLIPPVQSFGEGCTFLPVTTWYNTIFAGDYKLQFAGHDPPGPHGYRWSSATDMLILRPDGTSCSASDNVGVVKLPVYVANRHYLYIDTYDGDDGYLFVVDARNCKTLWQGPDMYGTDFSRTKSGFYFPGFGWLTVGPDCLPGEISNKPSPPLTVPLEIGQPQG